MKLCHVTGHFSVLKIGPTEPVPAWATAGSLFSITRNKEELSIICSTNLIPNTETYLHREDLWQAIKVDGQVDFELPGVLANLAKPLAAAKIGMYIVSTFSTDYLLIQESRIPEVEEMLRATGYTVE